MYVIEEKIKELLHNSSQNLSFSNNKVPIIQSMVYDHLIYTNDQYKNKINKSQKEIQHVTFSNKDDFDQFINKSINDSKFSNWKQVPIATKKDMVNTYISNDLNITHIEKSRYLEFFKDNNLFQKKKLIKYNSKKGEISNIDYSQIC